MAKKTKRKINKKGLIVILLTLYLIIMIFYYCFTLPIKNIVVKGNLHVSDGEIISAANIGYNTKIFTLNSKKIIKSVQNLNLIDSVNVKKNFNGQITIEVKELKILFYNILNSAYILSNGEEISDLSLPLGIPVLVNYVPSDIYKNLINKLSEINEDIISLISEIEYSPDIKDDIVIDENRFLFRMNDGNYVYINLANFNNISRYKEIYATLDDGVKGILNLDSSSDKLVFTTFESLNKMEDGEQVELSE